MPARVIRGEINSSRSLAKVSLQADLTFRALLVAMDDYGRCDADPLMLKADLFPRRPEVTPEMVRSWVEELISVGCLELYVVNGAEYLRAPTWERYRGKSKRAEKSRFPDPRGSPRIPADETGDPRIPARLVGVGVGGCVGAGGEDPPAAPVAPAPDVSEPAAEDTPEKLEADCRKASKAIATSEGDPDEKLLWLRRNLRALEAWCEDEGKQFRRGLHSWWNRYLAGPRKELHEVTEDRKNADYHRRLKLLGIDPNAREPEIPAEALAEMTRRIITIGG